jgi:peptide-methionine (S)-S-oxide reductase
MPTAAAGHPRRGGRDYRIGLCCSTGGCKVRIIGPPTRCGADRGDALPDSLEMPMTDQAPETAVLGGGCFWCLDAVFRDLEGVLDVESGYSGGASENPSYEAVCSGRTGHAEVVRVRFDPDRLSYADLLRVFFAIHDPTTENRQGNDVGTQYRSVIFAQDAAQRATAERVVKEIAEAKLYPGRIVTELAGAAPFYPAERYHQDYFERNPAQPYCMFVVAPKVAKFRKSFADRLKRRATS